MALKGTIEDFGVADIFQLIGQQRKTGVLILNDDVDDVRIHYEEGKIIRAESSTRPKQMLIGNILVNAEVITEMQLDQALQTQRRTLQRLGAVMVEMGIVDDATINEFATLQMTETVYRLFLWTTGTYEFEQTSVEPIAEGVQPIAAEHILLEGIRMIDEWPAIRSQIPPYSTVFQQAKPLPIAVAEGADIGPSEMRIHELVAPGRSLQGIIQRSRLGEFESCRAMMTLLQGGYVRASESSAQARGVGAERPWLKRLRPGLVIARTGGYVLLVVVALLLVRSFDASWYGVAWGGTYRVQTTLPQRLIANTQIRKIRRALEVHRLERGAYPASLDALVEGGFLGAEAIRFPFARPYAYRLAGGVPQLYAPSQ